MGPHIANAHGAGAIRVLPPTIDIGDGERGLLLDVFLDIFLDIFLDVFLDVSISLANSPSSLPGIDTLIMLMRKKDVANTSFILSGVMEPRKRVERRTPEA